MGTGFQSPLGIHKQSVRLSIEALNNRRAYTDAYAYNGMDDVPVGGAVLDLSPLIGGQRLMMVRIRTASKIVLDEERGEIFATTSEYYGDPAVGDFRLVVWNKEGERVRFQLQQLVGEERADGVYDVWAPVREI